MCLIRYGKFLLDKSGAMYLAGGAGAKKLIRHGIDKSEYYRYVRFIPDRVAIGANLSSIEVASIERRNLAAMVFSELRSRDGMTNLNFRFVP